MKTYIRDIWEVILENKEVVFVLIVVWVILFEEINLLIFISAIIVSVLVVIFTDRFLLKGNYEHSYMIGMGTLLRYTVRLIYEIYLAGIDVIPTIITGQADVQIIETKTKLTDELLIDTLANSITLTPGTVTTDKRGSTLLILALNAPPKGTDTRELIPLQLEKILLEYEKTLDGKA